MFAIEVEEAGESGEFISPDGMADSICCSLDCYFIDCEFANLERYSIAVVLATVYSAVLGLLANINVDHTLLHTVHTYHIKTVAIDC